MKLFAKFTLFTYAMIIAFILGHFTTWDATGITLFIEGLGGYYYEF